MPETLQHPLTPLTATITVTIPPRPTAPPGTPPLAATFTAQMALGGPHLWYANQPFTGSGTILSCIHALDWPTNTAQHFIGVWTDSPHHHAPNFSWQTPINDSNQPYDTGPLSANSNNSAPGTATARFRRHVSAIHPFAPMFAASPAARGRVDGQIFHHSPWWEYGAIPGTTPPDGHTTRLRDNADGRIHTNPGHVHRMAAFASAAQQWQNLDQDARDAWNAAGKALRPKIPGYALWTRIITAKRLDQIPALAARAGVTLVPPSLET